jgi:hypothetical protein
MCLSVIWSCQQRLADEVLPTCFDSWSWLVLVLVLVLLVRMVGMDLSIPSGMTVLAN